MAQAKPSLGTVIGAHLRADPRKTAVLAVLTLVMGGLYARWFFGATPEAAQAEIAAVATDAPPAPTAAAAPTSQPTVQRVLVAETLPSDLASDPFSLPLDKYPPGRPVAGDDANKTVSQDPIEAAARALVLQSTLCGNSPMACINGVFIRPGQRVNGFVLRRVEPTRVVLEREGVEVELSLR